jgi:pimeloyl-ACP methyl ester carboxylesterase
MATATLRGHVCHHEVEGPAGATPVLLVMGFGFPGAAWRPVHEVQRTSRPSCWYDNRGIAGSTVGEVPGGTLDLPALADDAAALLDHLGWARAHVVGVSMGGMIAQHLALRHRARLASLTLIATHPGGADMLPTPAGLYWFARANLQKGEARIHALSHLLFPAAPRARLERDGWFARELAPLAVPADPAVRRAQLAAILRHDVRRQLPALAGLPTLVVRPSLDLLVPPRGSDVLAAAIPGARLLGFPDAGHGVLTQEKEAINAALTEHFRAAEAP